MIQAGGIRVFLMADRNVRARLDDMRDAIDDVRRIVDAFDLAAYRDSWLARRAAEPGIEIISEASRHLPASRKELAPEVPWPKVAAMGNRLRHEDQRVDDQLVWNLVRTELPAMAVAVERMIAAVDLAQGS